MKSKRHHNRYLCLMEKPGSWIVLVLLCLSSITVSFAQPPKGFLFPGVLPGFGSSAPQARNVSRDPRFAVYEWMVEGERIFQINSSTGELLDVVTVTPDGYSPTLGFSMSSPFHAPNSVQPMAGGGAQCPCSTGVPASGPWGEIIGVFGAGGVLLDVVVVCSSKDSCTIHGQ
jgi:hypothetical protein